MLEESDTGATLPIFEFDADVFARANAGDSDAQTEMANTVMAAVFAEKMTPDVGLSLAEWWTRRAASRGAILKLKDLAGVLLAQAGLLESAGMIATALLNRAECIHLLTICAAAGDEMAVVSLETIRNQTCSPIAFRWGTA